MSVVAVPGLTSLHPAKVGPRPRVLLVTTQIWPAAAMMARGLHRAGFEVGALCPSGHPLRKTARARIVGRYHHLTEARDLDQALRRWSPRLVIPCDDLAVDALHRAHARYTSAGAPVPSGARLIEDSLGSGEGYKIARNKSRVLALAEELRIPVPDSTVITDLDLLERLLDRPAARFPVVLKSDAMWGGLGVQIVNSADEARAAFARMGAGTSWGGVIKDVVRELTLRPVTDKLRAGRPTVSLQEFVRGRPVNHAAVCWRGEVLGGVTVEVLAHQRNHGPGSLVRIIEDPAIAEAVRRLVGRLELSGFCGFDFMREESSGRALLIEINPRMTSSSYLPLRSGSTPSDLLYAHLTDGAAPATAMEGPPIDGNEVLALFPQELGRDPTSPYLATAAHLVPWDEPELVAECIRLTFTETWTVRLIGALRAWRRGERALD